MLDDRDLLRRYATDEDPAAFAQLVERYADFVYTACLRITGNRHDAEDAAQECFLALARRAQTIHSSLPAWLHATARHAASAVLRKTRREREFHPNADVADTNPQDASCDDLAPHIDAAIAELPETLRTAVILHYLQNKNQPQIAAELGIGQSTVSRHLDKGLRTLRTQLTRAGITLSLAALASRLAEGAATAAPAALKTTLAATTAASATHTTTAAGLAAKFAVLAAIGSFTITTSLTYHNMIHTAQAQEVSTMSATAPILNYGFRHDPMAFVENNPSFEAADVRTFVFNRPREGDRELIQARIDEILGGQREDGTFGDNAKAAGGPLITLLELGLPPDSPQVRRSLDAMLRQIRAGQSGAEPFESDGKIGFHSLIALCMASRGDEPEVAPALRWLADHPDQWLGQGCPWTTVLALRALWLGRDIVDSREALDKGMRWLADNINAAGCLRYLEPWFILHLAGEVDHPLSRVIVEKQMPMILRGQRPDGGWDNSLTVFRALVRHRMLEPLRQAPALPADWRVTQSLSVPEQPLRGLAWDGEKFWTADTSNNRALALSRQDGQVIQTIPLPKGEIRGLAWTGNALAVTVGNPWTDEPKRLYRINPDNGAVLSETALNEFEHLGGIAEVNGKLWIVDSFFGWVSIADPNHPENHSRRKEILPGPMAKWLGTDNGNVWSYDVWVPCIFKSDPTGRLLDFAERPCDGRVEGLAHDGQNLWALDPATHRLCAIEKNTQTPTGNAVRREGSRTWIEGVRGFDPCEYVDSVHGSQARILQTLGESLSYDDLICYSAFAFRVQFHETNCPSAAHPWCGYRCIENGYHALPWKLRVFEVPLDGKPRADQAAFEAEARAAVKASIDRGIPVHYGSEEDGLIIGYGDDGRRWWCVHPYHKNGAEPFWYDEASGFAGGKDKWPWGLVIWTEPKTNDEHIPQRQLTLAALKQAVDMWKTEKRDAYFVGDAAYAFWLNWLRDVEAGKVSDPKAGMQGNAWCFAVLIHSRSIAGRWLNRAANDFSGETANQLRVAADHYTQIADLCLKDINTSWDLAPVPARFDAWTSQMRQQQIARLQAACEHDRAAIQAITRALAAEATDN